MPCCFMQAHDHCCDANLARAHLSHASVTLHRIECMLHMCTHRSVEHPRHERQYLRIIALDAGDLPVSAQSLVRIDFGQRK